MINEGYMKLIKLSNYIKAWYERRNMSKFNEFIHRYAFMVLFILLIGIVLGFTSATKYYHMRLTEATTLGGVIIDNKVYDVKGRL